jgi:actin-related protein
LKVRYIIFFAGKTYKGRGPLEKPQEKHHYMFCPRQKNNFQDSKSEVHWYFYVPKKEKREETRKKRDERRETKDERRETRDKRRETREERREKREERRETRDERGETRDERRETREERREKRDERRVSERIQVRAIIFLNRPGQNEKSAKY